MNCFLMSGNIFLKPGDGALQPKRITNSWVYIQKKYFLIAFEENVYQFCFLLIRFDVCHHHSADLGLLSKEMVWWASVFQRGPAAGRQKVANSLFNFIWAASDGANKCFGRCVREGSNFPVAGQQGALGSPHLAPATPRLLAWYAWGGITQ